MTKYLILLLIAFCSFIPETSVAEVSSITYPGDTKLVVFNYDANNTYTILTLPGAITDIDLAEGEKIVALALGDSIQWITAKVEGHVFIKPTRPNLFTSATLVTNQRTYQLTLKASAPNGKWYQRVSWTYPDLIILQQENQAASKRLEAEVIASAHREEKVGQAIEFSDKVSRTPGNPLKNLNCNYDIKGEYEFKPEQVCDDGKFTWIRINRRAQELPALFVQEDTDYELVNYVRDPENQEFIKISRLFKMGIMKLGKKEVTMTNLQYQSSSKSNSKSFFGHLFE